MTNKQFIAKVKAAMMAAQKHQALICELEREYEKRFGRNPSDADDDFWIDTVHQGNGSVPTVEEITESAGLRV